jgi:single-strand DNA-binding protein
VSRSLNKVMLIGNLGNDPEVRSTNGGGRVATFSLATSRSWTGSNGEKQDKTDWHRCVVWNNSKGAGLADVVEKYAKKGEKVYVEGRVEYRQWQDKEGQTRYSTEVIVREFMLLGGKGGSGSYDAVGEGSASQRPKSGGKQAPAGDEFEDFPGALENEDDDLPF